MKSLKQVFIQVKFNYYYLFLTGKRIFQHFGQACARNASGLGQNLQLVIPRYKPRNKMHHTKSFTTVVGGHKPCISKRSRVAPLSEAAKALLSSPLPPELVVDFKGMFHAATIK